MQLFKTLAMALGASLCFIILAGCEQEGPAEEAGKEIDKAAEKAGKAVEHAGDKLNEATE